MCILKNITGPDALHVGLDIIPLNCQIADSQIGLNLLTNCHILHYAASDRKETLKVVNQNNGIVTHKEIKNTIKVEAIPCDDLIPKYGYFDLLKIDVEGFEATVLKGCRELLSREPKLIIELHGANVKQYGSNYEEIFNLISVDNYKGHMCLRNDNELRAFDKVMLLREEPHVTIFLKPNSIIGE